MGNPRLKARRQASWARAQIKKRVNAEENAKRARINQHLRAEGLLTPHEEQRAKRRAKRDALRAADLLPPIGMGREEWVRNLKGTS
jgi:hypothetical protein